MAEIELDKLPMKEFKAAREAGKQTVSDEEEAAPEINGDEDMKEFKEKRQEQIDGRAGVQKRIDRLVKQRQEARDESEKSKKEIAELKARYQSKQPDDASEIRKKEFDRFHGKVKEMREQRSDWKELEAAADEIMVTPSIQAHVIALENSHDVWIYLAKHPEVSGDLHKLPFGDAMKRIDKISLKLELQEEMKQDRPRSTSKQFEPIRPVTGGSTRSSVPLDEMAMPAFKKARESGRVR